MASKLRLRSNTHQRTELTGVYKNKYQSSIQDCWTAVGTHHLDNLRFAFILSAAFQVVLSPLPFLLQTQEWKQRCESVRSGDRCWDLKQRQLTSFCRDFSSLSCREYCFTSSFSRLASIFFSQEEHSCLSLTTAENLEKENK